MDNGSKELNIGRAGQYYVLADLLLRGVKAFSTDEGVNYDVVADVGKLIRLQVKTTQKQTLARIRKTPVYFFHLRRAGKGGKRKYQLGEFDGFALVALDKKEVFYLPFTEKISSNSACLRDKKLNYAGYRNWIRPGTYFQDLTWEKFIKEVCQE